MRFETCKMLKPMGLLDILDILIHLHCDFDFDPDGCFVTSAGRHGKGVP